MHEYIHINMTKIYILKQQLDQRSQRAINRQL